MIAFILVREIKIKEQAVYIQAGLVLFAPDKAAVENINPDLYFMLTETRV